MVTPVPPPGPGTTSADTTGTDTTDAWHVSARRRPSGAGHRSPSPRIKHATVAARRAVLPTLRRLRPARYSDADPYAILDVPTDLVTHMQRRWDGPVPLPWFERGPFGRYASLRRRWHAGAVLDGDWDLATTAFDDYHLTRVLQARFGDGQAWEEIRYVRKALRKVRDGQSAWGSRCHTEDDVWARCRYLDVLHARLVAEGFRERADDDPVDYSPILVNIGRDGHVIRNSDGKHRIILAGIIGIPTLRARVLIRHRQWQRVRDAVRRGHRTAVDPEVVGHPDLHDLLDHRRHDG